AQQAEPTLTVLRFLVTRKVTYGEGPVQKSGFLETLSPGLAAAFIENAEDFLSSDRIYEGRVTTYLTNLQIRGNRAVLFTCEDLTQYGVNFSRNEDDPSEVEDDRESTKLGQNEVYEFRLVYENNAWKIIRISRTAFLKKCPPQ
ncbi:MAG: hypothetical protein ACRC0L_06360, partial [Angustibacter sp.]